ncbi:MAG: hypothetical protein Q7S06_02870 [Nanoarchaeota archaeon]|nr:hypothetical protein [Nanoarchaeota archaeon]
MRNKLVMRLLVEGVLKQKLDADVEVSDSLVKRNIIGLPVIIGENHINPEAITDTEIAYKTFESIHNTEYPNKPVTIELTYF